MSWIKVISFNLALFFTILFSIEVTSGISRLLIGKKFLPLLSKLQPSGFDPGHPCLRMKTDVLLDHVPDHENECIIRNGVVEGDYVSYEYASIDKPKILTLGGSTTSGFYQHISNGETYPKVLAELVSDTHFLLNGGVGGYSSLQEFFKFARDGSRIPQLDTVVSLNGINDIPGYQGHEAIRAHQYPFMTSIQYAMNKKQAWIDQRIVDNIFESSAKNLFPNLRSLFVHLNNRRLEVEATKLGTDTKFDAIMAADRWETNVKRLNALTELQNARYFTFLQPTMGLRGVQSNPSAMSNDALIFRQLDTSYINDLRMFYAELIQRCSKLSFCYDLTDVAPPLGANYNDPRHHNANGNTIIANAIFEIISGD